MPDQIFAGESFNNGEQVSATRLNDHVGHAVLLKGCITQQIPHGAINLGDKILSYDSVEDGLRCVEISQILGAVSSVSGLPDGANIELNPYPGSVGTNTAYYGQGETYNTGGNSGSIGFVQVITANDNLLQDGDIIYVSGSGVSELNGYFKIYSRGQNSFLYYTYSLTSSHAGLLSWFKVSQVKINGSLVTRDNSYTLGNQYVDGNLWISGEQRNVGAVSMTGVVSLTGAVTATNLKADLTTDSTAITQTSTDNSTKIATTAFVRSGPASSKAWVKLDGYTGNKISGYNVASCTRTETGAYTITFTTAFGTADYAAVGTATWSSDLNANITGFVNIKSTTTTLCTVTVFSPAGYGGGHYATDASYIYVVFFSN